MAASENSCAAISTRAEVLCEIAIGCDALRDYESRLPRRTNLGELPNRFDDVQELRLDEACRHQEEK